MTELATEPRRAEKGRSLWQDAFRRLRKNRLAMVGLVVTIVVGASAILAPWISPAPPERQATQFKEQPPSFDSRWTIDSYMKFRLGEKSAYPFEASTKDRTRLELRIDPGKETRALVGIRGGRVVRLTVMGDMRSDPGFSVVAEAAEEGFYRVTSDNKAGEALPFRSLVVGEPVPPELADDKRDRRGFNVEVILKEKEFPSPVQLVVDFEHDRVTGIDLAGEPLEEREVRSWDVEEAWLDGERYEQRNLLGTDGLGRDLLSRILYGGRISLLIGLAATIVSLLIGVVYGATSGYAGGKVDAILMRIVDILYALPYMFLVILLLVFFGRNILILFVALGAVQWLDMARIVRGQVLSLKEKEFIEAARACGAGPIPIVFRHLIPNVMGVVVVYTTLTIPAVILQEAFLSFIGLKVEYQGHDLESWGALTDYGRQAMATDGSFANWWLLVFPAAVLAISLLCMNFLGDGLRDALDPRQKGRG